jgi:FkbM family methyltransferase
MVNRILDWLDKNNSRYLLIPFIVLNYLRKGQFITSVKYLKKYHKWYYKVNGIAFLSTSPGWAYSYDFLFTELKKISCYFYVPKEGDVVLDIGAGIGEESIIISKLVGSNGMVYSIEANPSVSQALEFIVKDNHLENIRMYNIAVCDKSGIIEIEDDSESPNNYLDNAIVKSRVEKKMVKVIGKTIDEFVKENGIRQIDFFRTNIEGAEQLMIEGMDDTMPLIKNIAISCHDFRYQNEGNEFFKTKEKVMSFLVSKGFKISCQQTANSMINDYVYASR